MVVAQEPQIHLWTREEYYRMAELGLFDGYRVELIEGTIFEMCPIGAQHATAVGLVSEALRPFFSQGYVERIQQPLDLGTFSDPQPDVVYVSGKTRDYRSAHPTSADLIVEVSESSLSYDRSVKAKLYARAGIEDYWILNLEDRQLEVYRQPAPDQLSTFAAGYKIIQHLKDSDVVSPLAAPTVRIQVADLLP